MAKDIMEIKKSVIKELENPNTMFELIKTTFKGFKDGAVVQQAILEGRIRGFSLDDFLRRISTQYQYGIVQQTHSHTC